jgi:hypothetical protein
MAKPARYRIHPAIGIARVGNAPPSEFFLGPERPSQKVVGATDAGTIVPKFKTGGLVKRQAVRFRVWEYVEKGGVWSPSREVSVLDKDVVELTWTVHLANRKASFYEFNGLSGSPALPKQPKQKRRNAAVNNRRTLEIDPLPRSIAGPSSPPVELRKGTSATPGKELWPAPQPIPPIESLGELRTDAKGRLIVVPGAGIAAGRPGAVIDNYANNDGWFDDVCDGPVTASLRLRAADGTVSRQPVQGAWVLVGPPDFAPDIPAVVNLYDQLLDLAVRRLSMPKDESVYLSGELAHLPNMAKDLGKGATTFSTYKVSFDTDVAPILAAALLVSNVFEPAQKAHVFMGNSGGLAGMWPLLSDPAQPASVRTTLFNRLRKPGTGGRTYSDDMPRLLGDDPYDKFKSGLIGLSLTRTQYAILARWAAGAFVGSALGPGSMLNPPVPADVTPAGLDRAALEHASGGAFFPGIEVGWLIREPGIFAEPFRIKHGAGSTYVGDKGGTTVRAGYFSRQMALPWLADFLQCKTELQDKATPPEEWGWWPNQRPDSVYPNAAEAAKQGTMLAWHRASVGASRNWPPDPGEPLNRPPDMPSYDQMIANWWKFAFVTSTPGGGFAEDERAGAIP